MSDSTIKKLSAWGSVIAVVLSITAVVFAAGGRNAELSRVGEALADHEGRIRSVESSQADMRADVRVIKQQMADLHRFFIPRPSVAKEFNVDAGRPVSK